MASKTKETIVQAYLTLLEDNEFDKITVTELVENCSISRQTFYYHFDDIEDMLSWAFNAETEKAVERALKFSNWFDAIYELLPLFEKYDRVIVSSRNSAGLLLVQRLLSYSIYHFTERFYKEKSNLEYQATETQQFLIKYTTSAIVGLMYMEVFYDNDYSYKKILDKICETFNNQK